jgi:hypothetical protein
MELQYQYSNVISHVLCRTTVPIINEKYIGRVLIVLVDRGTANSWLLYRYTKARLYGWA